MLTFGSLEGRQEAPASLVIRGRLITCSGNCFCFNHFSSSFSFSNLAHLQHHLHPYIGFYSSFLSGKQRHPLQSRLKILQVRWSNLIQDSKSFFSFFFFFKMFENPNCGSQFLLLQLSFSFSYRKLRS